MRHRIAREERAHRVLLLVATAALVLAACGTSGPTAGDPGAAALPDGEDVTVTRIVDGDTVELADGRKVRLIGIDTPESVHPSEPMRCFGPEATRRLAELLPPPTDVRLEPDVEATDRYGRTLAYLWRASDGLHVNRAMVADGFAQVYTVPPNVEHRDELLAAQRAARDAGRGLWGGCPATGADAAGA